MLKREYGKSQEMKTNNDSRSVAVALAFCLTLNVLSPLAAQTEPTTEPVGRSSTQGEGQIKGRVTGTETTALAGATIIAYHLSTETVFRSKVTDGKGNFTIDGLPYGYFDVAVQTADGLFVADQVVNVPPSGKVSMSMALVVGTTGESAPRGFAGLDQAAAGVAQVDSKKSGSFWKSSKGIAVLGGIGGVVLLAIALSGSDDDASPTFP